mgnify:CR=1 FL=1
MRQQVHPYTVSLEIGPVNIASHLNTSEQADATYREYIEIARVSLDMTDDQVADEIAIGHPVTTIRHARIEYIDRTVEEWCQR